MNKKVKKGLIEYGILGAVALTLYLTGLHTPIIGFLQQGLLQTGLFRPTTEEINEATTLHPNPPADFSLQLRNAAGEEVTLEEFRGKVIFINFWTTWCPPCIAEMPGINKLYQDLQAEEVVFLMVSLDDDFEKARRFQEKKGFDFDVYQPSGRLPAMYRSQSIPTTFVIDARGGLALTQSGMADYDTQEFREFLRRLQ
ncbi:TlpA family protein disulfide reductase [Nafulsella turpanensis]|uniref:TlpA family protein disulfide reductase n=1 Tax=Nafulsella turpanensis TaxID=1265690 RepID=UPI00034A8D13|nr:TlpA disulfide reductase family protein [Nafulsella turpanensis]